MSNGASIENNCMICGTGTAGMYVCKKCREAKPCARCNGTGREMLADTFDQETYTCLDCKGTGKAKP